MARSYPRFTVQMAHLIDVMKNDPDPLLRLGCSEDLITAVESWQRNMVRALRQREVTWDVIATALGMSRSAVLFRYQEKTP